MKSALGSHRWVKLGCALRLAILNTQKRKVSTAGIALILFCLVTNSLVAEDARTSMVNAFWLKSVVSVEQLDNPTNSHPIGTGFILQSLHNHLILITAKHVILSSDGTLNPQLAWRLNEKTNASDLIKDQIQTSLAGGWFLSSNVDLACRFITYASESDFLTIPTSL